MDVLAVVPVLATIVWAVAGVRRPRPTIGRVLRGAALGTALVPVLAAAVIASYHHELRTNGSVGYGAQPEAGAMVVAAAVHLVVVPPVSWIGLRLLRVRPAGLVTLGAWGLLGCGLALLDHPAPLWAYGLLGLGSYAVAVAATRRVPR